jgi:hypothetical protein
MARSCAKPVESGYRDPVQIVGNDSKKGIIFLEWSLSMNGVCELRP